MKRLLQLALAAGMLVAVGAFAAGPPSRPLREADQLDYVFLANDKPVLLRLHLRVGEKTYDAEWKAWMDKLFVWFDKNNDGWLSAAEVVRMPQSQLIAMQLQGDPNVFNQNAVQMSAVDADKDGKVTKEEFKAYYRNTGLGALRFAFNNGQATDAKRVNDSIYKRLDRDGDGRLTQEEFARLPQLLRQLDSDEDEMLTALELNTEGSESGAGRFFGFVRQQNMMTSLPTEPGLLELRPGSTGVEQVGQLLANYDRNKDGKLARNEIAIDASLFAALDRNRDGLLDAAELPALLQRSPELTFRVRVGMMKPATASVPHLLSKLRLTKPITINVPPERIVVVNPAGMDKTKARPIKRINGENVSFELGDSRITLLGQQGQNYRGFNLKQFYVQQFEQVEMKKGFVMRNQSNGNAYLMQVFTPGDKDGDDKLTKKELEAWMEVLGEGANCHTTLEVNDQGRSLFDILDANADTRLSIRETRGVWEKVQPLCKENKGLAQADLPRMLRLTLAQGPIMNQQYAVPVAFGNGRMAPPPAPTGGAPLWFARMDRNSDGDISPKEWLGTEEDFRKIDLDGDGLISIEETKKYEARKK